jgi:type I restriction enzyme S subunit
MLSDNGFVSWTPADRLDPGRLDPRFYGPDHLAMLDRLASAGGVLVGLGTLVAHIAHVTGYESTLHMHWVLEGAGVRVVEAQNIGDGLLGDSQWKRISVGGYTNLVRHHLAVDDIVFSKDGTLGSVALVGPRFLPAVASRHVFRLHPKRGVDGGFLAAWLLSSAGQIQTQHRQAGAVQGTIITPEVAAFRVLRPSIDIQRAIGNKLRKAERLRELADRAWSVALDHLARALGQRFDTRAFDAPKKDALNRARYQCVSLRPPISVADVSDEIGAQYFHPRREYARQVAARTGEWEILKNLARPVRKKGKLRAFVGLDRIDSHTGVVAPDQNNAPAEGVLFEENDILFSRLRPYLNKVTIWTGATGVGSPELLVFRPKGNIDPHYLFTTLKSPLGLYQVIDVTSGSTHPRVDEEVVAGIRVPRLPDDLESQIGDLARSALSAWKQAPSLVDAARLGVEALIDGTLDEAALLAESDAIERWLAENPSPSQGA